MTELPYLTADELSALIDCKPNQRSAMMHWLDAHGWIYVPDRHGFPKVARAYHNRQLGITEAAANAKYAETPNLDAFG